MVDEDFTDSQTFYVTDDPSLPDPKNQLESYFEGMSRDDIERDLYEYGHSVCPEPLQYLHDDWDDFDDDEKQERAENAFRFWASGEHEDLWHIINYDLPIAAGAVFHITDDSWMKSNDWLRAPDDDLAERYFAHLKRGFFAHALAESSRDA